jgi:hypothetical protein
MVTQKTSMAALAGASPVTKSCIPTYASLCRHSVPISSDGKCTRRWCTGRPRTRFPVNHNICSTLPSSGRRRRKSFTRRPLAEPRSARTKIEQIFDPDAVQRLKANAGLDIAVEGPELASQAINVGLVDEFLMIVCRLSSVAESGSSPMACGSISN